MAGRSRKQNARALQEHIVAHHVGARGFSVAFNCPAQLRKHLIHVVYEADEQCAKEMIAQNKDENFHVLPYCLGQRKKPARLFICKNPYASSNLEPNPAYGGFYCEVHQDDLIDGIEVKGECYDLDYGSEFSVVRVADVTVRTLDDVLDSGDVPSDWYPDFLSLDTQGSELAILHGGQRAFREHCLALATEVEFHQLYKNQPLFPDIFQFAHRHGFHFAGFDTLWEFSSYRLPIGARDKGFTGFGDALFLRSIESVRDMAQSEDERYLALFKLAFIALNFGYLEYAVQAADVAETLAPAQSLRDRLAEQDCYKAVHALRAAVHELPPHYPHRQRTAMMDELRAVLARAAERQNQTTDPASEAAESHLSPRTTAVEAVLEEYGFTWVADSVRRRRKSGEGSVAGKMHR